MDFQVPSINLVIIAPVIIVLGGAILAMVVDLFVDKDKKSWAAWVALVTLLAALAQTAGMWGFSGGTFIPEGGTPMIVVDNYATFLNITLILTGILAVLISVGFLRRNGLDKPEYYMLLLFSLGGMMLMGMANDLILVFLALEVLSIPLYILSGFAWPRPESEEAAMKYFILGAFSSAIFVFGIALAYGATGTTSLPGIFAAIDVNEALGLTAVAFLLVGFAFKVAAVPFHMWTPDVYEGAPTTVTAFMSVGAKVAGFAAMIRVFVTALDNLSDVWVGAVVILATLTLIVGNLLAIAQTNIKRMLAYSSIAHAGFILIAVAASYNNPDGVSAALFYMFAYLFTNLGAFAVVIAVEHKQGEGVMLDDYKGLAARHPWLSLAMAFMMLSLAGVPPTGGFSAKFYVFRAALESQMGWLAVLGVVMSVVSAFYYLRVVFLMYMYEGETEVVTKRALKLGLGIAVAATFVLGIFPGAWFDLASQATLTTFQAFAGG
ncbi:MAG TPA: NADH-quinone oxidoreductase subunit N [Anaerolineae bacterium]|nr:NADH-quinone oxidoreductase subunit N [Anaerolineae bacterium]